MMPCLECGRLSKRSRCPQHERERTAARNAVDPYQHRGWRRLSRACVRRDGACLICGSTVRMTANHIEPRALGGPDHLDNLMTMCGSCHSTYESAVRWDKRTELRDRVDTIRRQLAVQRGLTLTDRGGTA